MAAVQPVVPSAPVPLAPVPVVDLGVLRAGDLARVGGKAANLGELLAAGLPVPGGFCVTTDAYARAAGAVDPGDPAGARALLRAAPVPADVAAAVASAYRSLGNEVPVAVRSSATAEDLPTASFAGQQDTVLNVVGAEAVLDAVRRCWASLWTDRAVAYRREAGVADGEVRLAVVVQRMIDAQVAGVLFTADPVSGRRTRAVLDASPGLGEAVVSGMVNPDHLAVEPGADGRPAVVERRLGDKAVAVRALPGGGTETVTLGGSDAACLTDDRALALVALGRRAEEHFGVPQDVEWALDADGTPWLTQARPITTLYPAPASRDGALRAFFCASLAQGLTRPITPMGLAGFGVVGGTAARLFGIPGPHTSDPVAAPPAYTVAGGRAFVDVTAVLRNPVGRRVALRGLTYMEARAAVVVTALLDDPAFALRPGGGWRALRRALPVVVHFRVPLVLAGAVVAPGATRRWVARRGARADAARTAARAAAERATPGGDLSVGREHLDRAVEILQRAFPAVPAVAPVFAAGLVAKALARRIAGADLDDAEADELLRGLPHNVTTEMDLRLWALAERVRHDPAAAAGLRGPDGRTPGPPSPSRPVADHTAHTIPAPIIPATDNAAADHTAHTIPAPIIPATDHTAHTVPAPIIPATANAAADHTAHTIPAPIIPATDGMATDGLAERFRAGTLPPVLQEGLAGFLREYGHRAVAEIDLGMPRWSDDPAHVLGALANYLRLDPASAQAPDARFAAGARSAEAAVTTVVARVRRRSRWRARVVAFLLRRARQLIGMRETHKDHLVRYLAAARAAIGATGAELAARGLLDAPDDVFFLDLREARSALAGADHRDVVAARRAEYARELRRRHVPRILLTDGTEPEALAATGPAPDGALAGSPASAGTVTATARVVLDPVGAHLEPGEVLVAPSTDPGWTPLFLTAGALVMEMGGANSHGAVVAREYGIPAVVGVAGATHRIRTGDVLTVDGAAGLVRPVAH